MFLAVGCILKFGKYIMKCEKIYLKEHYSFLGENGKNPYISLFLPENLSEMNRTKAKRPCMIICPGGAYAYCSQRESEPIVYHFLTEGFNVFTVDYSVAPHAFPSQLCEIAATVELIYKNQDEWNCDTDKILIGGFSAGGHLAAHYSTMYDCKEVREYFPESKPVAGTVLGYPVITSNDEHWHAGSFKNLMGKQGSDEECRYFSCELNVKDNTPPAFIWHTAEDAAVPVMNSILYAEALSKYKIPFELHIYPFGPHGLATADNNTNDDLPNKYSHVHWLDDLKKWLKIMGFKI